MKGKLILVVGPSGSGKGTLINHIKPLFPSIRYPRSCTTRAMRDGEVDGESYYFLSVDEFKKRIDEGQFLEWAEYGGHYYGTLQSEVLPVFEQGGVALKELEVQGARQIRQKVEKDDLVIIFISAGSWADMETRIRSRGTMPEDELVKRRARYDDEVSFMPEADFVIQNSIGKLDEAKAAFAGIIGSFLS